MRETTQAAKGKMHTDTRNGGTIAVNGKRVNPRRNGASVNLRNLPRGRFTVVIRLRLADGGRVRDVRRYRTCTRKVERDLPRLRTQPPKKG